MLQKWILSYIFLGIFFTEGQLWLEQRRFSLRNMRDFGFGRREDELESEMQDEILSLIDLLKNGPKYEFEKVRLFRAIHNNLWHMISHSDYLIIFIAYRNTVTATVQSFQIYFFQPLAIIC